MADEFAPDPKVFFQMATNRLFTTTGRDRVSTVRYMHGARFAKRDESDYSAIVMSVRVVSALSLVENQNVLFDSKRRFSRRNLMAEMAEGRPVFTGLYRMAEFIVTPESIEPVVNIEAFTERMKTEYDLESACFPVFSNSFIHHGSPEDATDSDYFMFLHPAYTTTQYFNLDAAMAKMEVKEPFLVFRFDKDSGIEWQSFEFVQGLLEL